MGIFKIIKFELLILVLITLSIFAYFNFGRIETKIKQTINIVEECPEGKE